MLAPVRDKPASSVSIQAIEAMDARLFRRW
jgi:hypothetical protein